LVKDVDFVVVVVFGGVDVVVNFDVVVDGDDDFDFVIVVAIFFTSPFKITI